MSAQSGRYVPPNHTPIPGLSAGGPAPLYPQVANPRRPANSTVAPDEMSQAGEHVDAHPYIYAGSELTGRDSGLVDVQRDGPTRPSVRMLVRTWYLWAGSDATAAYDPPRGYYRFGTQSGQVMPIYGGQPGYWQPYGQRGSLAVVDASSPDSGRVLIQPGPPHGLHSQTAFGRTLTGRRYSSTPQQRGGRQNRLLNSNRAGQTYSQTTLYQGQAAGASPYRVVRGGGR